jgi:hypothetical protein
MSYLCSKFHTLSTSDSLVVTTKRKAKDRIIIVDSTKNCLHRRFIINEDPPPYMRRSHVTTSRVLIHDVRMVSSHVFIIRQIMRTLKLGRHSTVISRFHFSLTHLLIAGVKGFCCTWPYPMNPPPRSRDFYLYNIKYWQETNTGGFQTRNPSKPAATDLPLKSCGHRLSFFFKEIKYYKNV